VKLSGKKLSHINEVTTEPNVLPSVVVKTGNYRRLKVSSNKTPVNKNPVKRKQSVAVAVADADDDDDDDDDDDADDDDDDDADS
jgi:hypothetical protein